MTPTRELHGSFPTLRTPGLLAASLLLGLLGCATDDPDATATARSDGPLTATAGAAAFGRLRVGTSGHLSLQLDNRGRSEVIIRQITLIPPDPYAPESVPPDPCLPPDPYREGSTTYPPDPYHNPPGFHRPEEYLTTRLIAPCVRPSGSTTVDLGFAALDAGGFAAGIQIEYATGDGEVSTLTVPATACVVR